MLPLRPLLFFACLSGMSYANAAPGLLVGMGKAEMHVFYPGVGMYGYGVPDQVVKCQDTPLYARAMLVSDPASGRSLLFVSCELAFMSKAVKDTVLYRLQHAHPADGFTEANVMITAIHTHSAPGGFFLEALFNLPTGGFHYGVFNGVVNGIVSAVEQARDRLATSTLEYGEATFSDNVDVAYNRALSAFNADLPPDQWKKPNQTNIALDRTMRGIKVVDAHGVATGLVNWFGVHATCRTNKNTSISSDNKGYASSWFEDKVGGDVVAIFAQEKAGDVSPNYHGDDGALGRRSRRSRKRDRGKARSMENGRIQAEKALELFHGPTHALDPIIDHELMYVKMNDAPVDADLAPDAHTTDACYGKAFAYGTPVDGKGQPLLVDIAYFFSKKPCKHGSADALCTAQGNKKVLINAHRGLILNTRPEDLFINGGFKDLKRQARNHALGTNPWVQETVPVQLFIIGELCVIGVPGEITTHAGEQLENTVLQGLASRGVKRAVLATYANAYIGYVTTQKGYQCQTYEGGHTIFGQWELAALQTAFRKLAREMADPLRTDHEPQPRMRPDFDAREVGGRVFPGSWNVSEGQPCVEERK